MPAPAVPRQPTRRSLGQTLLLYAKGLAMGGSDVIPGVSGGTVALIVGIYEDLLRNLGTVTSKPFLDRLRRGRIREAFNLADGAFLLTVIAGVATAVLVLSHPIAWLLEVYPSHVDAAFFGLILASTFVVAKRIDRWGPAGVIAFALAAVGAFLLVNLDPVVTPGGGLAFFLSGAVAICALVLPGISGAFILVLLGKYQAALAAVAGFDMSVLIPLGLGIVVGLLSFVRVMAWLLRRYHDVTMAALTGFMLGSLRKVWPFGPELMADGGAAVGLAVALVLLGVAAVLLLERAGRSA